MNKCLRCFKNYENSNTCPFCGYKEGTAVKEPHYLNPGVVLQQRYIIGIAVGAGGFGVTYAAWDQVLNQKVAIKEYMPGEFSTRTPGETQVTVYGGEKTEQFQQGKEKFSEESRRLAAFHNIPGIVQIFNTFHENGTVYIVMEFLGGETLEERLKRENKIEPKEAVEMMLMILQALETVHKVGILHRDIAPNNIFLTKDGEVKLLDFGAARSVTGTHSKSLTVLYKEGYTPEEQYRSRGDQGPWTDVYACAATLYRMLTGEVPPGSLERRMKDTLKPPVKKNAKISRNVSTAVMNALNVDADHRTRSAEQFRKELTGEIKSKKHYRRTAERRIGKMPAAVKFGTIFSVSAMVFFLLLLETGVIHVDALAYGSFTFPEGKTRVPNIVNCEIEEAQIKLENAGLKLMITDKQVSMQIPENRILSQGTEAGTVLDIDTEIKVTVSAGVNSMTATELEENGIKVIEMPDLQYMDRDEALSILADARVDVAVEYETTGIVEGGKVTKQSVNPGEKVIIDSGTPVILTVEDFVIDWTGTDEIEDILREKIGQKDEDVYASQLLDIEELYIGGTDESWNLYPTLYAQMNVSILKNCLNVVTIHFGQAYDVETNATWSGGTSTIIYGLDELSNLINLEYIDFDTVDIDNLSWLSNMKNLKDITILFGKIEHIDVEKELDNLSDIFFAPDEVGTIDNTNLFRNVSNLYITSQNLMQMEEILPQLEIEHWEVSYDTGDIIPYLAKIPAIPELYFTFIFEYTADDLPIFIEKLAKDTAVKQLWIKYEDGTLSLDYEDMTEELNSYR